MIQFSLKYLICRKIVYFIQIIILCNDILVMCHFPSKIYINTWYKFLGEIEQFFEKGVNLVVNFGKNDYWF